MSFLKLYDSLYSAINDDLFKNKQVSYFTSIQLSPNETYLQVTDYTGGISISSDFEAYIVNSCDDELLDITEHVFIQEFIDYNGQTQCKIEIVNINKDFGGRAVQIRIDQNTSDVKYYTRPIKITNKDIDKTYRFDYYNDYDCYESIRLLMRLSSLQNNTEVSDYFQISTGNNISFRPLKQIDRQFSIDNIDTTTFLTLQDILLRDIVYIDGVRMTNKPVLEFDERIGFSNVAKANFVASMNDYDVYAYTYQIFEGFDYINFTPIGSNSIGNISNDLIIEFSSNVVLNTGFIEIYEGVNLVESYDETDITVIGNKAYVYDVFGVGNDIDTNGNYYVLVSEGLFSSVLGMENEAITSSSEWEIIITQGDFDGNDFDSNDFLTD